MGQLSGLLGGVTKALGGSSRALRVFRTALISTGIGAILVALGSLITLLTKTQEGTDALNRVLGQVGATVDVLIGRFAQLGQALTRLFRGDFRGALEGVRDAFSGIGDEIQEAVVAAGEFEDARVRLRQAEIDLIETTAENNRVIAEQRLISNDVTRSIEERLAAAERANATEIANLNAQLDLQQQRVDLAQQEIDNTPENLRTDEQRRALAEESARLLDLQTQSLTTQRRLQSELNTLKQKQFEIDQANTQEVLDQLDVLEKQVPEVSGSVSAETSRIIIDTTRRTTEATSDLTQQRAEADRDIAIAAFGEALEENIEAAFQFQVALAQLGVEGGKFAKSLAVAQAVINTRESITAALKQFAGRPVLLALSIAQAIAIGTAQVRGILNTQDPTPDIARPSFAQGGIVYGRSHKDGGEKFAAGGRVVELEGGEAVINKRSTKMFRPMLSKINQIGGGKAFQFGGVIPSGQEILGDPAAARSAEEIQVPVLVVEDVSNLQTEIAVREERANLG